MASKRKQRRSQEAACKRKIPFHDEAAAIEHADNLRKKTNQPHDAYKCPIGNHYHVGHRSATARRAIKERRKE